MVVALQCGDVGSLDDRICKYLIKEYALEASIRELGELMCCLGQAKWVGNGKEEFQATLYCVGHKYLYKA